MSLSPGPLTPHGDGFFTWHAYDPSCKAELWSTAFFWPGGTLLFDPIDWPSASPAPKPPVGIVRSNANHDRNCQKLAAEHSAPWISNPPGYTPISLPGAGEGETAFFHANSGSLVVGDALIHLPPSGLMVLPEKYCTDPALLKKSLAKLLVLPVRRIFFAHGAPILQDGLERIQSLLA